MNSRVDYDLHQWAVYAEGRAPSPAVVRLWSRILGEYIERAARPMILDLGSGVGTYSQLLAELFDATVVGIEPSARMRAEAEREHPREPGACAAELFRAVRPGGLVIIRSTLRESLPRMPFLDFLPAARQIDERRLPSAGEVVETFVGQGFEHVVSELIEQETMPSFRAYYERIKLRAISTLELISDADFEAGIARMKEAAERETSPRPVIAPVDLLALRRSRFP